MSSVDVYASGKRILPNENDGDYHIGKYDTLKFKIKLDKTPCMLHLLMNGNEKFTYYSMDDSIEISSYEDCVDPSIRMGVGLPIQLRLGHASRNDKMHIMFETESGQKIFECYFKER